MELSRHGTPIADWFIREDLISMGDLEATIFMEITIFECWIGVSIKPIGVPEESQLASQLVQGSSGLNPSDSKRSCSSASARKKKDSMIEATNILA